jgi:hypothetical protein
LAHVLAEHAVFEIGSIDRMYLNVCSRLRGCATGVCTTPDTHCHRVLDPRVRERTVMGIMGRSSTSMTRRYQHVRDPIRQAVADQVDGLLRSGNTSGAGARREW